MVSGHLQVKNKKYYAVLSYYDSNGKRFFKWVPTGIPENGGLRKAEKKLTEIRCEFRIPTSADDMSSDMPFTEYLEVWLRMKKSKVTPTTLGGYTEAVKKHFIPFFEPKKITLGELKAKDIQAFILYEQEKGTSSSSVNRMFAIIRSALVSAYKLDLVESIAADKVEKPRKEKYLPEYFTVEEIEQLFKAIEGHSLDLLIRMTVFYGLRREEVLGLKWSSIDFDSNLVTIRHIVTKADIDGKTKVIMADRAKTKSSIRSYPLVEKLKEDLLAERERQAEAKRVCGDCYCYDYDGYVFVDELGRLYRPDYISHAFSCILKSAGLKHIRFHDLRHSTASLMLKQGIPMKQIQEWLGHSNISTTSDIYAHLDATAKKDSANTLEEAINI